MIASFRMPMISQMISVGTINMDYCLMNRAIIVPLASDTSDPAEYRHFAEFGSNGFLHMKGYWDLCGCEVLVPRRKDRLVVHVPFINSREVTFDALIVFDKPIGKYNSLLTYTNSILRQSPTGGYLNGIRQEFNVSTGDVTKAEFV